MRRRATAATSDTSVLRNVLQDRGAADYGGRGTTATTQLSNCLGEVGNVRGAGMADEGAGGPVSILDRLRPIVRDVGSDSEVDTSEEEEEEEEEECTDDDNDEGSDSSDDSNEVDCAEGPRSTALALRGDGPATNTTIAPYACMSVVPTSGALHAPIQPQTGNIASYGNISVKDSTGLHFGNKTIYHGPVIIEQHVYGSKVVKQFDDSLKLKHGGGPFAITNGSESVVQLSPTVHRRTGLELSPGSLRIGASSGAASKGGSGFLWRHLLGRRPGSSTWVAWIALSLGCMAIFAVILTVTILNATAKKLPEAPAGDTGDVESEELTNGYKTPAKQQRIKKVIQKKRKKRKVHLEIIPRAGWIAFPPKDIEPLNHPVPHVIISHTSNKSCCVQSECTKEVRRIQEFHMVQRGWSDIAYNFLVGGDGKAYEGRGWDRIGAHSRGYNSIGMGISFIGNFNEVKPPKSQMLACLLLIEKGVMLGKISPNYKLLGHRQVSPTDSPGKMLYKELQKWKHWSPDV